MTYCSNCGTEVDHGAVVGLSCGYLLLKPALCISHRRRGLATASGVFGSSGFYHLILIGSLVGIITGLIGMSETNNYYIGRAKVGFWVSISSLAFWILILSLFIVLY